MTVCYLLDTNILSNLIREPQGTVQQRIIKAGEATVCTGIVVACELRFGAAKSGSTRLRDRVAALLGALPVLPLASSDDEMYAEIRHYLESEGNPIGPNDLLIAAQARRHNLVVVTANEREFGRVPSLAVENWL